MVEITIKKMTFTQDKMEDWLKYVKAVVNDAFRDTLQGDNPQVTVNMKIKS